MISAKNGTEIMMASISIGILVALGSIGIVKAVYAVEPPVTQEEARTSTETTQGLIGIGVNEEGQGELVGVGFATGGRDASGQGGLVGVGYGGDAPSGGQGGTGIGEGDLIGFGHGGDAPSGGQGGTGIGEGYPIALGQGGDAFNAGQGGTGIARS